MTRPPVKTLEDLAALEGDVDDMVEGYRDGRNGEPEPGANRSPAYCHGWRNGDADRRGKPDEAQRQLARELLGARGKPNG